MESFDWTDHEDLWLVAQSSDTKAVDTDIAVYETTKGFIAIRQRDIRPGGVNGEPFDQVVFVRRNRVAALIEALQSAELAAEELARLK